VAGKCIFFLTFSMYGSMGHAHMMDKIKLCGAISNVVSETIEALKEGIKSICVVSGAI
jgi:hypothetical protein